MESENKQSCKSLHKYNWQFCSLSRLSLSLRATLMALEKRGIRSTRAVLPKACPTSMKEIMFIKHCAYNPTADCLIKLPTRRGKLSLPGGAVYLGKFSGGKPVGKGRLVDLARKKEKGKFASVAEIFNRFSCFFFLYFTNMSNFFSQNVHQEMQCGSYIPRESCDKRFLISSIFMQISTMGKVMIFQKYSFCCN